MTVTVPQLPVLAAQLPGPVTEVLPAEAYATDVAAVCPELPSVQVITAGVGEVVLLVAVQPLSERLGAVGLTVRLIDADAAVPLGVGVAASVPL